MFAQVIHADWSTHPRGRWFAVAHRGGMGWAVEAPRPVGNLDAFRERLLLAARRAPVLAGFDFPIGVPRAYGVLTGLPRFRAALQVFGRAVGWERFYDVALTPADIAVQQPFYPGGAGKGAKLQELVDGLGLTSAADLLRSCERGGSGRRRASPLFWTVGAAQVGRAAMAGWQDIVVPALEDGAQLWPFDDPLDRLAACGGLVIAETYPADSYAAVGAPFRADESKRRQADRRGKAEAVLGWAAAHGIDLAACEAVLRDGFGPADSGEDPFDALLGLLHMLAVVGGPAKAMKSEPPPGEAAWEGWILGR